jgi:hypothetical protein
MFGDRWRFGIECEIQDCELDPWGSREPYGSLWLWAAGQLIGNSHAAEQLIHGFGPLESARNNPGNRRSSDVPGTTNLDKLDFIIWVRFGDDSDFDSAKWGTREIGQLRRFEVSRFEVLPRGHSPFHDGWEAVLLDDAEQETLVWRRWRGDATETHELSLPHREFTSVITLASDWFRDSRRGRIGAEEDRSGEKPRLVKRIR